MALRFQRIYWGAGFVNVIEFRLPWHRMMPRENRVGESVEAPSGVIDADREGLHQELELEAKHIPPTTSLGGTGYYGATGVRAFLTAARDADQFKIRLDRDDPGTEHTVQAIPGTVQEDRETAKQQLYFFRMRIRDVNGTAFEV